MSTNRRTAKIDRTVRDAFRPVADRRHRTQSELIYRWLLDAYQRAEAGKWLPPKAQRAEYGTANPANVLWSQDAEEFDLMSAAISAAGSSVRAVVEHGIRWYVWRDGDLLAAPQSPFERRHIPQN